MLGTRIKKRQQVWLNLHLSAFAWLQLVPINASTIKEKSRAGGHVICPEASATGMLFRSLHHMHRCTSAESSLCMPPNVLRPADYCRDREGSEQEYNMHELCYWDHVNHMNKAFFHGKSCSHQSLKIHIHILRKCHHVFSVICLGTSVANTV